MSILAGIFGVVWTIAAASMGGGIFALFGIIFIVAAISSAVYNLKNATSENRYSSFDIVDSEIEPDPFNERFGSSADICETDNNDGSTSAFCPYCGTPAGEDFEFCKSCGKKLP